MATFYMTRQLLS